MPVARSSLATVHRSAWQLSASSWMSTMLRTLPSLGSALAASRNASDSGPVPRGVNGSSAGIRRSTSSGSGWRNTSTSLHSLRR